VAVSTEVSSLGPRGSAPFTVASSMLLLHTQVSLNSQESWQIDAPRDIYFDTGFVKLKIVMTILKDKNTKVQVLETNILSAGNHKTLRGVKFLNLLIN
jgi:hypothetical protein